MLKSAVSILVFLPALVCADTVYFKESGMKLDGKVLRETDDFIILLVHDEAGQLRIAKSKIERIEYDLKSQTDRLEKDDYVGLYKVGLWAMEKGMYADAIKVFESLKGKEGVAPEMQKLLAQAYEKRQQKDLALKNYTEFAQAHPEDTEVATRVQALTKEITPATPDDTPKKIEQGLEKDGAWVAEKWNDANPCNLTSMADNTGRKFICVEGFGGNKDKIAFSRAGDPLNLSESKDIQFRFHLKCPSSVQMAMAFTNAQGKFYETKRQKIAPNSWIPIRFDLQGKDFKAEDKDGKWEHIHPLNGKERITKIFFLVYDQRPFTIYMDSIYFSPL